MSLPVPISNRVKNSLERLIEWEKIDDVNALVEKDYAPRTIAGWIRDNGGSIGNRSMESYVLLYNEAKKQNTTVKKLLEDRDKISFGNLLDTIDAMKEVPSMIEDVGILDKMIREGSKLVIENELISGRDLLLAIKTKDDLLNNNRDKILSQMYRMEENMRRIFDIIVEEVPEVYKNKIMERLKREITND